MRRLSAFLLLLLTASSALAVNCSDPPYFGVIDGNVVPAPDQIQIDTNCTVRNYPGGMSTNFSFMTQPGQTDERWLIIFDNVVHTGQMACNAVAGHHIWFTNGSSTTIQEGCQNLLIPVEKIDKQNPGPTATVGVPFTYTLTMPVLFDPATGTVINVSGSVNDLHSAILTDDLNATGVDLSYVSHVAYWKGTTTAVPHTFSNAGGVLTFSDFPIIPAGQQIVIELTVVLNDSPVNVLGTQFINTAKWQFGRLIDGTFYEPLPGEWGVTPPMTIAAPNLVVTKDGPDLLGGLNLGEWGQFTIDVWNSGALASDAWNVTIRDQLPSQPTNNPPFATGGMCDLTPQVLGVTLAGNALTQGADYSVDYTGASCVLTLTLLDAAGPIGPDEHLIVTYQTKLDADSEEGATFTNVAGVTQWFNGDSTNSERQTYTRTLTNGTVGTLDHEDAHTLAVVLSGYFFEKTVANLTRGVNPATQAAPGDTLRYTLRLRATDAPLNNLSFQDDLGALNTSPVFVPGSLTLVSVPPGADTGNTNPNGGTNGAGLLDIRNLSVPANSEIVVQFDITLSTPLTDGIVVTNQADLMNGTVKIADSDDPTVNGQADPAVAGDEDPTRVLIQVPWLGLRFEKTAVNVTSGANPAVQATPGDTLRYTIAIENLSGVAFSNFRLADELDRLNSSAAFAPGTLNLISAPAGADSSNTTALGGLKGTGLVDIRNLNLGVNQTLQLVYEVRLAGSIANATSVLNQAQAFAGNAVVAQSDDPNINGAADPNVFGDEDPTRVQIVSAPTFQVLKTSTDLTNDPNILLAGERLRYTITVKNIGTDDATDVTIRDQIPVNTAYVAGSTTLNGVAVSDISGSSPLINGMLVNAPENTTPGAMRADATSTQSNVATITFEVIVNASVIDGTVISNQAFLSAIASAITDVPSDDPGTAVVNDPTRDVVGNSPLLFADKRAVLVVDGGSPNLVDPGDVLRYTVTVYNTGAAAATGVVLSDAVPANTTYVADSVTLNGLAVGRPDGGVSPLVAGIDISSSNLTPPLPTAGQGTISIGNSAVVQFDLRVNDGVAAGTLISNQATARSYELPPLLTDGDGNPATGPEPTVVVVGAGQQLSITKQVSVVGGGAAVPGAQLEYLVRVTNIAQVPAQYVVITDDLNVPAPGYLTYVDQSATLNSSTNGIGIGGSLITADYSTTYGPLAPGASIVLRFRATINATLAMGTRLTNTANVGWNNTQTASASVSIDVGGVAGVGLLSGTAWHDANFDKVTDSPERLLVGWTVDLHRNGQVVFSTLTDSSGTYRISGVVPNYLSGDRYELRFRAPGAGPNTALLGLADSPYTNGLQRISGIVVEPGSNLQGLNLPIEPNGVVYNAMSRTPIAGATLTLMRAGSPLPASCFDDTAQQNQITLSEGYYRFDINFSDPACPGGASYIVNVTGPGAGYVAGESQIIPPTSNAASAPFSVLACQTNGTDAIAGTLHCEVQTSPFAPPLSVQARSLGTQYHVHLTLDGSAVPDSSQLFNNHIPLDPVLDGALGITKTTPLLNVTRGQLVPYTITFTNTFGAPLADIAIVDRFPAGFRYVEGSARIDRVAAEPLLAGRELTWSGLTVDGSSRHSITLLLAVGAGVGEGEFVNRAQAIYSVTGNALSGEASATVRVMPDPTFDCTDAIGKVFDDANRNGTQEADEPGLSGVRLVTARGLTATTDTHGRYHMTCAITPHEGRGSNFVLKLDDRTLPSGYRSSIQPVRVERATRGKILRMNFAASIHRVVGLDLADAVFEPGATQMRLQWKPRVEALIDQLKQAPAVLRLSYLADLEDEALVQRRLSILKDEIMSAWKASEGAYPLTIEPEVFWRLGAPQKQPRRAHASAPASEQASP